MKFDANTNEEKVGFVPYALPKSMRAEISGLEHLAAFINFESLTRNRMFGIGLGAVSVYRKGQVLCSKFISQIPSTRLYISLIEPMPYKNLMVIYPKETPNFIAPPPPSLHQSPRHGYYARSPHKCHWAMHLQKSR
jgi:hypothetical protein